MCKLHVPNARAPARPQPPSTPTPPATRAQVRALNGQRVMNMKDLVRLVDTCKEQYLHFELEHNTKVILRTAAAKQATQEILATHCIASDRSDDLKDI